MKPKRALFGGSCSSPPKRMRKHQNMQKETRYLHTENSNDDFAAQAPRLLAMEQIYDVITKQNSLTSPLLRLPTELRTQIWTHLHGSTTLHFEPTFFMKPGYTICLKSCSNPTIFEPCYTRNCRREYHSEAEARRKPRFIVPLVCKQFWYEVLDVIYETCVFSFGYAALLKSWFERGYTTRVRHVSFMTSAYDADGKEWANVLIPSHVSQFIRLKTLQLFVQIPQFPHRHLPGLPFLPVFYHFPLAQSLKWTWLRKVMLAFQVLDLREDNLMVRFFQFVPPNVAAVSPHDVVSEDVKSMLAKATKRLLLEGGIGLED